MRRDSIQIISRARAEGDEENTRHPHQDGGEGRRTGATEPARWDEQRNDAWTKRMI